MKENMVRMHLNQDDKILAADFLTVMNKLRNEARERREKGSTILFTESTIDIITTAVEKLTLLRLYPNAQCPQCSAPYRFDNTCPYCGYKLWY